MIHTVLSTVTRKYNIRTNAIGQNLFIYDLVMPKSKIETVTMQYTVLLYCIRYWGMGGYTFPLGLLMGKRAALRPLMPSAAAFTAPCCAPLRSEPCSGRISETRAQLPTLSG